MNSKPKSLAEVRRQSLALATSRIYTPTFAKPERVKGFTPILFKGGIGDAILSLPLLDEIVRRSERPQVYSAYPDVIRYFRTELSAYLCTKPFPGFDWWLSIETVPKFVFTKKFHQLPAQLLEMHATSKMISDNSDMERWVGYQPQFDFELWQDAIRMGLKRHTIGCHALGLPYKPRTKESKARIDMEPFITVHDGYDNSQNMVPYRATKTWNLRHWGRLVEMIKDRYQNILVVQLGSQMSRPIPGVDVNLSGRLRIEQSFNVLGRSVLHIDGDSGMVHAAHAMGVKSVVLFGPTPLDFFGYADNYNVAPPECGSCGWTHEDWMNRCALFDEPKCMDGIQPGWIFDLVKQALGEPYARY